MTGYRSLPKFGLVPIADVNNAALCGQKLWGEMRSKKNRNSLFLFGLNAFLM
jgi:hypothetical protein